MINTVAIAGVGLIGGSFALALRKAGFAGDIVGVDFPAVIAGAVTNGVINRGVSLGEAAQRADLIYLAQPIDQILLSIASLGPILRADTLVTDAGSTKVMIVQSASEHIAEGRFIGGHPMSGKEQRGYAHSDGELFRDRPYVLTPSSSDGGNALEFRSWLAAIGAQVIEMDPREHDETVALTSHLPQLLSTALSAFILGSDLHEADRVFGPGLLDMTRLALSAPEVWLGVLRTNKVPVRKALQNFREELVELEEALNSENPTEFFARGAAFSRKLRHI